MIKPVPKRTFVYGAALALAIGGIGAGLSVLHGTAAEGPMVEMPIFEVDPLWPKPLPNEGLLGMTIGVSVDAQDNVWIVHRGATTLNNNEKGAELNPPVSICCKSAPPVHRVQPGRRRDPRLGRPGPGLRVAGIDARRPCRLQGQCLARRQRRQGLADPQIHQGRQVPAAVRPLRQECRQQRSGEFRARGADLHRSRRPTKASWPTATATSASR